MTIASYVAHIDQQKTCQVQAELDRHPSVSCFPSAEHNLFVIVTDTVDRHQDKDVRGYLESVDGIQCLSLAFAWNEEEHHDSTP